LNRQIGFMDIPEIIETTMSAHDVQPCSSIEAIVEADIGARELAGEAVSGLTNSVDSSKSKVIRHKGMS